MLDITAQNLTRAYLFRQWIVILVATICSFFLGAVGAGVIVLFGPAVKILSEDPATFIDLASELGPRWVQLASHYGLQTAYPAGVLLAIVPLSLVVLAAIRALLSFGQWYLWEYAAETASLHLRRDVIQRFLNVDPVLRLQAEGRQQEEELSATVSTDVRMLREYYVHYYGGLPREAIQILWFTAVLLLLSPKLTAIFFLGVVPGLVVIQNIGRKLRRRAARALSDSSLLTEWLQQRLSGIETIKHYRTEEVEAKNMAFLTRQLFERFFAAAKTKARTGPLLEVISIFALVVVLLIALSDVAAGVSSGAAMLSFFACLAVLGQSAGKLGRYFNANREGLAARDRIVERFFVLSSANRVLRRESSNQNQNQSLVLDNVSFQYPGAKHAAMANVTMSFVPGKVYCIVGPSGAGKSTLLRVVLGLFEPTTGQVRRPNQAGKLDLVYMPQAVKLAQASVAQNIAFPDATIDRQRVEDALCKVDLMKVIGELPEGMDTEMGASGRGLSGGQAQRVLLARLWYHDAALVVIDEGTSALDPEVEQRVVSLVRDLAQRGSIVLMVAHRAALAEASDEVITMQNGKISYGTRLD